MGIWYDVKPKGLSREDSGNRWVFAYYLETPSEREDGQWLIRHLFRDKRRTVFGVKETSDLMFDHDKWAYRVIHDREFRDSCVSDDPDLRQLWKRH